MKLKALALVAVSMMVLPIVAQEHLSTQDFKNKIWDYTKNSQALVMKSKVPVILDFYADWCRPCKMLAPELIQIQKDYKGRVLVYKINIEQEEELARIFGVQSIPTLYFIKPDGKYTATMGYRTQDELKQVIDSFFFNNNIKH